MTQQARNEFYRDVESLAMDFAAAVNAEARELEAAGADLIQLDEPWLRNDPEGAKRYAVPSINRALEGLRVPTVAPPLLRLRGGGHDRSRPATRSSPSWPRPPRSKSPSRPRSPGSTWGC